jgi:hypothetical protein
MYTASSVPIDRVAATDIFSAGFVSV